MKTSLRCVECSFANFLNLLDEFGIDECTREKQTREFLLFLSSLDYGVTPPEIGRTTHMKMRELLNNKDPYYEKKKLYNKKMMEKYENFKEQVLVSQDPVMTSAILAIGGNIIDFSPKTNDMDKVIDNILNSTLKVNHVDLMIEDMKKAERILYLTDNAGEIVLDKLFIQMLIRNNIVERSKIVVAAKGYPVINDATLEDAEETGLTELVRVVSNGDCTPGTLLRETSEEFRKLFESADVVISKGQGNFETLDAVTGKNIYFMLIAKCRIIAEKMGVGIGDFVCKKTDKL